MPPKKQKDNKKQPKPQAQSEYFGQNAAESQKNEERAAKNGQPFECICGKKYGSLAAVHTHINNKHPQQKKKYKAQIINPKKSGQPSMTSIRMKDINFNEIQAELMCHADMNLKTIYQFYSEFEKDQKDKTDILIDVNEDDLSDDSDLQIQGIEGEITIANESKRRREINQEIQVLKQAYKLGELGGKNDRQLQIFKEEKFKLNLISELSKFFIPKFAAKIEFSLLLIHVSQKLRASPTNQNAQIDTVLDDVWKNIPQIKAQLLRFYRQWNKIRFHYRLWKAEQTKNEKANQ